jgi:hypothetical protein
MRALLGILSGLFLLLSLGGVALSGMLSGWEGPPGASPYILGALVLHFFCFFVAALVHPSSKALVLAGGLGCLVSPFALFGIFRMRGAAIGDKVLWVVPMAAVAVVWGVLYSRQQTSSKGSGR